MDLALLQKKYYELSRQLHPDRFYSQVAHPGANPGGEALKKALEKMSFVNSAYQTLKDERARRSYLLQLEGVVTPEKAEIPMALTEAWFELQDLILENPEHSKEKSALFFKELEAFKNKLTQEITQLERKYDAVLDCTLERALLERMAGLIQKQNYIQSLEEDFNRKTNKVEAR